jgi:hypothetical protein
MDNEGSFFGGESGLGVKLTSYLQLVPRPENMDLFVHFPIRLHGVVLTHNFTFLYCH